MRRAVTKAQALPRTADVCRAKTLKASRIRQMKVGSSPCFFALLAAFFAMHHSFALGAGSARIRHVLRQQHRKVRRI